MSERGCGWRVFVLFAGIFALALSGLFLFGAASSRWDLHQIESKWPAVTATIQHCEVVQHKRRNSTRLAYIAECAVTFKAGGEVVKGGVSSLPAYFEHRPQSWANPGIDELRAWVAAHADGSTIAVRYNPSWPPQMEPDPVPPIFDRYSNTVTLQIAGIAAVVAIALIALPFAIPR